LQGLQALQALQEVASMADTVNELDMEFTTHVGGIITSNAEE
jgi:hypothetical protein